MKLLKWRPFNTFVVTLCSSNWWKINGTGDLLDRFHKINLFCFLKLFEETRTWILYPAAAKYHKPFKCSQSSRLYMWNLNIMFDILLTHTFLHLKCPSTFFFYSLKYPGCFKIPVVLFKSQFNWQSQFVSEPKTNSRK